MLKKLERKLLKNVESYFNFIILILENILITFKFKRYKYLFYQIYVFDKICRARFI